MGGAKPNAIALAPAIDERFPGREACPELKPRAVGRAHRARRWPSAENADEKKQKCQVVRHVVRGHLEGRGAEGKGKGWRSEKGLCGQNLFESIIRVPSQ